MVILTSIKEQGRRRCNRPTLISRLRQIPIFGPYGLAQSPNIRPQRHSMGIRSHCGQATVVLMS